MGNFCIEGCHISSSLLPIYTDQVYTVLLYQPMLVIFMFLLNKLIREGQSEQCKLYKVVLWEI